MNSLTQAGLRDQDALTFTMGRHFLPCFFCHCKHVRRVGLSSATLVLCKNGCQDQQLTRVDRCPRGATHETPLWGYTTATNGTDSQRPGTTQSRSVAERRMYEPPGIRCATPEHRIEAHVDGSLAVARAQIVHNAGFVEVSEISDIIRSIECRWIDA